MKEDLYDDLYEEKEEKIDFHALLFRYVIRWPWFVASVIICLGRSMATPPADHSGLQHLGLGHHQGR